MGSQASKGIRKLPKSSLPRASPGSRVPTSEIPPFERPQEEVSVDDAAPIDYGRLKGEASTTGQAKGGLGKVEFSGEKDDAITKDAMDPQFMRNLQRLGPVEIQDAGKSIPADAQRTLRSRRAEYTESSAVTPTGHLTMPFLISLFDRLKALPPGSDPTPLYKQFGVEKEKMEELRKWVNSVSIEGEDSVRVEDSKLIREMKAVWIGGVEK